MENEGNNDGSENPVAITGSGIDTDGGESLQIGSEIDTNGGESEEKQIGSEIDTNYGGESQQIGSEIDTNAGESKEEQIGSEIDGGEREEVQTVSETDADFRKMFGISIPRQNIVVENEEAKADIIRRRRKDCDKGFFSNYDDVTVHRNMIQDTHRMEAYNSAVLFYKDRIEGKVIVDVGCGTGILSIFCAKAGARKVYAIEASQMALHAKSIIEANGLSHIINVLHTTVEDATIAEEVDVIISEWMGHMLFQENMLPSVISARDRWLAVGGLVLPTSATLYMAPFSDSQRYHQKIGFWSDVDGIDMSVLIPPTTSVVCRFPSVETVEHDCLLAEPHQVIMVDMYSITSSDVDLITTSFRFHSRRSALLHGFVLWFVADFSDEAVHHDERDSIEVESAPALSTAPDAPSTHWEQTLLNCPDPLHVEEDQVIEGILTIKIDESDHRLLRICLNYGLDGELIELETQF
ncbi:probable protein arginine N-methyltransferase 6.1 isoform X2 [Trifolium pratense]|uniref:Uncharacterized protein n=1 Tax=Trifolium pratense TaxID=57577 RepID=A0ACB0KZ01_TRIPR|nr:probable protein arginine N-methyltransferase 6.1 isoform X2 [Trifolium pratense]CAJ2661516.1 unnamed protein product [Trifolium pratense]